MPAAAGERACRAGHSRSFFLHSLSHLFPLSPSLSLSLSPSQQLADLKNATVAKIEMLEEEKAAITKKAVNLTKPVLAKKLMIKDEVAKVANITLAKKAMIVR